ncbi:MAG: hypothetical protein M3370_12865 [Actinomycetota bacterium]|nr:hypothetical protein [Actinomycetota bacterium]
MRWHLHDLWPELEIPTGALDRDVWLGRLARKLGRAQQSARVRIARELVAAIRQRTRRARELERGLGALAARAPQLLAERGCGTLTAPKLIGQTAGAQRFATDAQYARTAGVAPIPSPLVVAIAGDWIAAVIASSTARCTASRSTKAATTPRLRPTSRASRPKSRHAWKFCAASSATSPAASGACCATPSPCPCPPPTAKPPP